MQKEDYEKYRRELSRLNEIRVKWWAEFRSLRNELLNKYDEKIDEQALELNRLINDMWESGLKEEIRRRREWKPKNDQQCIELDEFIKELRDQGGGLPRRDATLNKKSNPQGLYESNHLCPICGMPVTGNPRRKYCSEPCRKAAKARRYRENNPDEVMISKFHYLDDVLTEEEKER